MSEQKNEERNIIERFLHPTKRGRIWQIFIGIILLVFLAGLVDAGAQYNRATDWVSEKTNNTIQLPKTKEFPFNLGLDLQGGTHLIYKANVDEIPKERRDSAVQGVRDVIERRVNALGVNEPNVRTSKTGDGGYRIEVELAGIRDVEEAIEKIGETPLLEFKERAEAKNELTEEEQEEMAQYNKDARERAEEVLGKLLSGGDFEALVEQYDEKRPSEEERSTEPAWITERGYSELIEGLSGLKSGEIKEDIIETDKGYAIVKFLEERVKQQEEGEGPAKEVKASHLLICHKEVRNCGNDLGKEEAYEKIKEIKQEADPDNFAELVKEHSTEPGAETSAGDLGWIRKGDMVKPFEQTVFEQEVGTISYVVESEFGYHLIHKQEERNIKEYKIQDIFFDKKQERDYLEPAGQWKNTELSGKHLTGASATFTQTGEPQVSLEFNSEGADLFKEITERNVGKQVAIFLDGQLETAPTVNEAIPDGRAVISGKYTLEEAKGLAQSLNAGALPVPIEMLSQKTIGPSLGAESISSSLTAGLVGLALVALFMIIVYRLAGLLAVVSLAIYGILLLSLFKLFAITITLGSLAGFIVSIGMAVDANVLIFERLKEELRTGKDMGQAIKKSFSRAWPSIRDGNISTLITAFILMQFTTGVVRGFAITLFAGILISMFSAIIITRNFMNLIPEKWLEKHKKILIKS
jgi:protein-export membrane protein SecD